MEVKVDLARLQILNDRICQTIDALNQVRATSMPQNVVPGPQIPGFAPTQNLGGLSHSTPWTGGPLLGTNPWVQNTPVGSFGTPIQNPYLYGTGTPLTHSNPLQSVWNQPNIQTNPYTNPVWNAQNPFSPIQGGFLSHSTPLQNHWTVGVTPFTNNPYQTQGFQTNPLMGSVTPNPWLVY